MKRLILASASPRRKEIFEQLGFEFEIKPSSKEPPMREGEEVREAVLNSARTKAEDIFENNKDAVVVGADTVVVLGSKALGKPKDTEDAKNMLRTLSGKTHEVLTGVYLCSENTKKGFVASTKVEFYELSNEEIEWYVGTGEPMDKAGSYGIQCKGVRFVKGIVGDYFNVVGFPAAEFMRTFKEEVQDD